MIGVILPTHLQKLANAQREVALPVEGDLTFEAVLDALEAAYPPLHGTIRDPATRQRRPYIRFFACGEDWSHEPLQNPLPELVAAGEEPLRIVGALAGG